MFPSLVGAMNRGLMLYVARGVYICGHLSAAHLGPLGFLIGLLFGVPFGLTSCSLVLSRRTIMGIMIATRVYPSLVQLV